MKAYAIATVITSFFKEGGLAAREGKREKGGFSRRDEEKKFGAKEVEVRYFRELREK